MTVFTPQRSSPSPSWPSRNGTFELVTTQKAIFCVSTRSVGPSPNLMLTLSSTYGRVLVASPTSGVTLWKPSLAVSPIDFSRKSLSITLHAAPQSICASTLVFGLCIMHTSASENTRFSLLSLDSSSGIVLAITLF